MFKYLNIIINAGLCHDDHLEWFIWSAFALCIMRYTQVNITTRNFAFLLALQEISLTETHNNVQMRYYTSRRVAVVTVAGVPVKGDVTWMSKLTRMKSSSQLWTARATRQNLSGEWRQPKGDVDYIEDNKSYDGVHQEASTAGRGMSESYMQGNARSPRLFFFFPIFWHSLAFSSTPAAPFPPLRFKSSFLHQRIFQRCLMGHSKFLASTQERTWAEPTCRLRARASLTHESHFECSARSFTVHPCDTQFRGCTNFITKRKA